MFPRGLVSTGRRGAHARARVRVRRRRGQGGRRRRAASVRARPRHGSVGGLRGPAARRRRLRAEERPAHRTPDRGGHRQAARAGAGGQGLRRGVLV